MDIHGSLTTIDFAVIVVYIISVLSIGFWVSFRKKHTDDIFLAGRNGCRVFLSWYTLFSTLWIWIEGNLFRCDG